MLTTPLAKNGPGGGKKKEENMMPLKKKKKRSAILKTTLDLDFFFGGGRDRKKKNPLVCWGKKGDGNFAQLRISTKKKGGEKKGEKGSKPFSVCKGGKKEVVPAYFSLQREGGGNKKLKKNPRGGGKYLPTKLKRGGKRGSQPFGGNRKGKRKKMELSPKFC